MGAALPVTVVGVALAIVIVNGYLKAEEEKQAYLQAAYEKLNQFKLTLVHMGDGSEPFQRMQADWATRRYTAKLSEAVARTCTGELSGEEAVALLGALREVELVVLNDAFPCAGTLGAVERELDWFIPEAKPPNSGGKHAITAACVEQHPALDKPFAVAAEILAGRDHARDCAP